MTWELSSVADGHFAGGHFLLLWASDYEHHITIHYDLEHTHWDSKLGTLPSKRTRL
jgi:hypothetical protein